jgi:hypothetical protein
MLFKVLPIFSLAGSSHLVVREIDTVVEITEKEYQVMFIK